MEEGGQKDSNMIEAAGGPVPSAVYISSGRASMMRMAGVAKDVWTVRSQEAGGWRMMRKLLT